MFRTKLRVCLTLLASLSAISAPALAQAINDTCGTAITAGDGTTPGTNNGATTGPDPIPACGSMSNDVWYAYTATCTGTLTVATCAPGSANFDTVLAGWGGSCGCLFELACNDDFCAGNASQITFPVVMGTLYYVSVGGFDGAVGTFSLFIGCTPGSPMTPPANDHCAGAIPLTQGSVTAGSNVNATTGGGGCPGEPLGSCVFGGSDVWYSFIPACSGTYQVTTCLVGTAIDTVVTVWDGSAGCGGLVELSCNDDSCSLPGQGLSSTTTWPAVANTVYYVSVAGFAGATGAFSISVNPMGGMGLSFVTAGPGTLGYAVVAGPPFGAAYTAITLAPGNYPSDWFFGIAITLNEIASQIAVGFPFILPLDVCGGASLGPVGALPAGLTVYAVSLGLPPGSVSPTVVSNPATGTVP
jgi:hypothetical protein